MIKCNNINFKYNKGEPILKDCSLEIVDNDCYALLGHNGAGKTTLFRVILGLLKIDSGEIQVDRENIKFGYLPENNGVYEKLTAMQNLEFRGRIEKLSYDVIKERGNKLLKLLRLDDVGSKLVGDFSNGMKKRLALASVLMLDPSVVLLDEPTNGIDPESMEILVDIINDLKSNGKTIVCITHNLDFVRRVCNKFAILEKGQVLIEKAVEAEEDLSKLYLNRLKLKEVR